MKKPSLYFIFLLVTLIITGCQAEKSDANVTTNLQTTVHNDTFTTRTIPNITTITYPENSIDILLNENSISYSGEGATVEGTTITITSGGTYRVSGNLNDGQIIINVTKEENVTLELAGVSITSSTNSPIYAICANKTIIDLLEGTVNTLTDATNYTYSNEDEEPNACLFSKDDLTIKGEGLLNINGQFNNGIGTKDDLKITGGIIYVSAVNNALKGNESISVSGEPYITITDCDNGFKVDTTDETKGLISISGGDFDIKCSGNALNSSLGIVITGGTFSIKTNGGYTTSTSTTLSSCKGLKSDSYITISDASMEINSCDDAIHADIVTINSGSIIIYSGDDAIHGDSKLTINNGSITVKASYEGLESESIIIENGLLNITASDDGLNAAGGTDGSGTANNNPFSQGGMSSSSTGTLTINGGNIYVNASGDGLDANGSISITGGIVFVEGPTNNGNGTLDYDSTFTITGGTLIGVGSSGMAQNASAGTQCSALVALSLSGSNVVNVSSSTGVNIATFKTSKKIQCIVISSPNMLTGSTYTISSGGTCNGTIVNGIYDGGVYSGGTVKSTFTMSSTIYNGISSMGGAGGFPRR